MDIHSWEEAVRWYRSQPDNETAIRHNFFDLPVLAAAERYAQGEEFAEVLRILGDGRGRRVLDVGAGAGIASFGFAQAGWQVTALEPDPSKEVGAGAISDIAAKTGHEIKIYLGSAEDLDLPSETFDAAHARQVLHHATDLDCMLKQIHRVLKSGGILLATREHVVDDEVSLQLFRTQHPLHHLYGGENAFPLRTYLRAFEGAGFRIEQAWGAYESILNFYPGSENQRQAMISHFCRHTWFGLGWLLQGVPSFRRYVLSSATARDRSPGRLFSFVARKV